jgi:hypothetical protein
MQKDIDEISSALLTIEYLPAPKTKLKIHLEFVAFMTAVKW